MIEFTSTITNSITNRVTTATFTGDISDIDREEARLMRVVAAHEDVWYSIKIVTNTGVLIERVG